MVVGDLLVLARSSARKIAATRSSPPPPSMTLKWCTAISCDPALEQRIFEDRRVNIDRLAHTGQTILADMKQNGDHCLAVDRLREPERLDIEPKTLKDRKPKRVDHRRVTGQAL